MKNKNLLSDIMEKVKATEMQKILPRTRVIMRRVQRIFKIRRRRKWFLRMAVKLKTPKRATTTLKTTVRKQKVIVDNSHETSTTFHSKNPCEHCENSNVFGTLIMKCPNCSWHDSFHQIRGGWQRPLILPLFGFP